MPDDSEAGFTARATDLLIRARWPLLIAAVLLTGVAWPTSQRLELSRGLLTTIAEDSPYLEAYRQSREIFGTRDSVIVGYAEPNLFESGSYQLTQHAASKLRRLEEELEAVEGVEPGSAYHIGDALEFRFRTGRLVEMLEGMLIGPDHETVAIVLQLQSEEESPVARGETLEQIRRVAEQQDPQAYVAGEPLIVHDTYEYLQRDGQLLFYVSLGLLAFVTLILFRGLRWLLLPVAVVLAAIVWTRAILAMSGFELSMVSAMLNSLITIIAVATVMHVIVQFRQRHDQLGRTESFRRTGIEIGPPIFWTCATTAAGFAALLSSEIHPVRSFATMMTLGAMLVFVAAATILPGGVLNGGWNPVPKRAPGEKTILGALSRMARLVERHPWIIGLSALALAAGTGFGLTRLQIQSDPTRNFRASTPIVKSLEFIENRLGGTGEWEVYFPAPEELTSEYLERVARVSEELRAIGNGGPELTKVNSLTDWVALIPEVPLFLDTYEERLNLLRNFESGAVSNFYNAEAGRVRILLRSRQRLQSEEKLRLIRRVEQVASQEFPEARVTGSYVLMAHTVKSLLRDQLVSFGLATAGIVLMTGLAFRSVAFGLIAIVPNCFPILLVVGTMGWIGLPVNMGTAMIAAVSMGLTVDGTIHYMAGYRRARRAGLDRSESLRETHKDVGRALLFATLALVIGFSVLTLSHFLPLVHFGVLISFAMAGGLIADLLLLPVLLRMAE